MQHIFGFVDDYSKVTYGMRDMLRLIHKDALFRTAAAGAGPIVQPNDVCKVNQEYCHE